MPKDPKIKKVLVLGSGPIVIGQAAEFDYAGTQACRALKEEGVEVVLVNSNPATIMTDPDTADVTYIEPLNCERLEQIIAKERPRCAAAEPRWAIGAQPLRGAGEQGHSRQIRREGDRRSGRCDRARRGS